MGAGSQCTAQSIGFVGCNECRFGSAIMTKSDNQSDNRKEIIKCFERLNEAFQLVCTSVIHKEYLESPNTQWDNLSRLILHAEELQELMIYDGEDLK